MEVRDLIKLLKQYPKGVEVKVDGYSQIDFRVKHGLSPRPFSSCYEPVEINLVRGGY